MSAKSRSMASDASEMIVKVAALESQQQRQLKPTATSPQRSNQHSPLTPTRSHLSLPQISREMRRLESTSSTHSTASVQRHWIESCFKKRECAKFIPSSSRASRPSQNASVSATEAYEGRFLFAYGYQRGIPPPIRYLILLGPIF